MNSINQSHPPGELPAKAQRVRRILYIAMAIMMLLPVILFWLVGAIRFEGI
ncbi:hypothetical protein QEH59_07795 [Coraliomargarita sp. SDUM461004]|uniref:Sugar ABC transporter permease n=1 Tax=Thalassobacterium sedimentorum TaxID=3041258 RepID=A0ABU1AHS0_9BACT|nr:hypothetical protein [Coraliomargarita sp. SDUM461004]MDQ8194323.1 hypothetical protein [Coraliomargarita sp. SDUM461004]